MTKAELYEKAKTLPMLPGVYIIRDKDDTIIYIGKAKKLRNRVSQYFKENADHLPKVQKMVENAFSFDVIVTNSEFEALTLECSQIKQYSPKYNILLKDDKGYNFIKISKEPFPRITAEFQVLDDSKYLGPYMSSFAVREMVATAQQIFRLPTCNRVFPRDFGKERPCLNYHIKKCMGVCTGRISQADYNEIIDSAVKFIKQDTEKIIDVLQENMEAAAENLEFEKAALIRDQITAIQKLSAGQNVVNDNLQSHDFIALTGGGKNCCVSVLRFRGGRLMDKKEHVFFGEENTDDVRDEFLVQFYSTETPPKNVMLDAMPLDEDIVEYIQKKSKTKVNVAMVHKGENLKIIKMAYTNAVERLARETGRLDKSLRFLDELANMLGLPHPPHTIESYDISNWGDGTSVAGMIVFEDGKPKKSGYRTFKMKTIAGTDDYGSMQETLSRRVAEFEKGAPGQFGIKPDVIFLDGGKGQLSSVLEVLAGTAFEDVPVFGMVKDSKHRTRAMVGKDGEIAIAMHKGIFKFVTEIQDEVHRFSIEYQRRTRKSKSYAVTLTKVPGIGPKKAENLMRKFKTVANIKAAEMGELIEAEGITYKDARNIYEYFHYDEEGNFIQ
ncbi:MAG: excinuclease ABC subunit UvrC [Oscillospiraceae bacterium]|nr:excinuclease ABC subunit UvrC [Oscillospiraceae bacterium]